MAYDSNYDLFMRAFEFGQKTVGQGIKAHARFKIDNLRGEVAKATAARTPLVGADLVPTKGAVPVTPAAPDTPAAPAASAAPASAAPTVGAIPLPGKEPVPAPAPAAGALPVANAAPAPVPTTTAPALPVPGAQPPSEAMPTPETEEAEAKFVEPAVDLAKLGGWISRGDYTDAEAKEIFKEFTNTANQTFAHYGATAIATWGTPVAVKAVKSVLQAMNPSAKIAAEYGKDGNMVISSLDDPDLPATRMDLPMLQMLTAQAQGGTLAVTDLSEALQTAANVRMNAETAAVVAGTGRVNAVTAAKREAREERGVGLDQEQRLWERGFKDKELAAQVTQWAAKNGIDTRGLDLDEAKLVSNIKDAETSGLKFEDLITHQATLADDPTVKSMREQGRSAEYYTALNQVMREQGLDIIAAHQFLVTPPKK